MSDFGINIGSRRSRNVITPTFSRDFATIKTLNHGIGPSITFTRASSATFFTSTGTLSTVPNNIPRFDHGNIRTNLISNSEAFNSWSGNATVSGNVIDIAAPNNTYTAEKITFTSDNRQTRFNNFTPLVSSPYTASIYLKGESNLQVRILMDQTCSAFATATFCNVTTDWQRFTLTYPGFPTTTSAAFGIDNVTDNLSACDGTYQSGIVYVWGAQVESGLSATPYIPTTTTAVTTSDSLGLLIEESRSNLLLRSGNFDTIEWTKLNATATAEILSPDGTTSGYKLEATNTTNVEVKQTAIATSTSMTFSVFLKAATGPTTGNIVQLRNNSTPASLITVRVNLGTGAITYINGSTGAITTNVGNGWWRVSLTATSGIAIGNTIQCSVFDNWLSTMSIGDSVYAWGAQLEAGAFPTSYIETITLSATRQPDNANTDSSSFFNINQGTLFAEIFKTNNPNDAKWASFTFSSNSTQNLTIQNYGNSHGFAVWNGNVQGSLAFSNNNLLNTTYRLAGTYRLNDIQASQNGVLSQNDNTGIIPSNINKLSFGSLNSSQFYLNNHLRKVVYWPSRLSNNRLRLLTF